MSRKRPIFYGWYLVGLMIIGMTLVYGVRASFSTFFPHILDKFDWYRGSTAIMFSLNILVYGLTAPFAGRLVDRWKARNVAVIGIFTLAIATAGCYFATELWHYYLLFGILAPLGTAFCGSPVFNPALINWFGKRRGVAVTLGQIGGGLSFAYVMFIEWLNTNWDFEYSFFVMAGVVVAVLLPLYLIFFYHRPEDKNMKPYDADIVTSDIKPEKVAAGPDWTLKQAFKTPQLWLIVFSDFCFWGIGNYLILAHQIQFAEDAGYSNLVAASVFALFGIVSILGQIGALVSEVIGRELTAVIAVVLAMAGLGALMSVQDTSQIWMLYFFAVTSGFATGLFSPTAIVGAADIFHGKNVGALTALVLTGVGFGGAIGPWLGGFIHDTTGSYHIAFLISLGAYALAGISFWIAAPRNADKIRAKALQ
ncbi:MAG: MFS transporter [Dehalococcoidales bacterium]|nr:MFS transporter [Dehalococcoidales bacterium]